MYFLYYYQCPRQLIYVGFLFSGAKELEIVFDCVLKLKKYMELDTILKIVTEFECACKPGQKSAVGFETISTSLGLSKQVQDLSVNEGKPGRKEEQYASLILKHYPVTSKG